MNFSNSTYSQFPFQVQVKAPRWGTMGSNDPPQDTKIQLNKRQCSVKTRKRQYRRAGDVQLFYNHSRQTVKTQRDLSTEDSITDYTEPT
jgi:hypothetical protein